MIEPYFTDGDVALYLGDYRDVLAEVGTVDLVVADPPYGETSLEWDRWVDGWPSDLVTVAKSMWCFGSMRMFLEHGGEFTAAGWKFSQDVIWEKHNGSGFQADRFKRVHEHALHWYRGEWRDQYRHVQTTPDATARTVRTKGRPPQLGDLRRTAYVAEDGGPRLMRSVLQVRSMHGKAIHPTEKPVGILTPLIEYACPMGGGPARSVRGVRQHSRSCSPGWASCDRRRGARAVCRGSGAPPVADHYPDRSLTCSLTMPDTDTPTGD